MAKISLSEYANLNGHHRQQVGRWKKAGRLSPPPELGVSASGRACFLIEEGAVVVDITQHRAAAKAGKRK